MSFLHRGHHDRSGGADGAPSLVVEKGDVVDLVDVRMSCDDSRRHRV